MKCWLRAIFCKWVMLKWPIDCNSNRTQYCLVTLKWTARLSWSFVTTCIIFESIFYATYTGYMFRTNFWGIHHNRHPDFQLKYFSLPCNQCYIPHMLLHVAEIPADLQANIWQDDIYTCRSLSWKWPNLDFGCTVHVLVFRLTWL